MQNHPGDLHVAIGVFDGLHMGHQTVVKRAIDAAKKRGGEAALLTFDPHPIRVITPTKAPKGLLTPLPHKARIAESLGLEVFAPLHFDRAMVDMLAEDFLGEITSGSVKTIAVGEDWRFGHNREGDVHFLRERAGSHEFTLEAVPPVMWKGDRISSTRIRQALLDGNLANVKSMLGRPWSFFGTVREGDRIGRTLGFPTANLIPVDVQLPPRGVWTALVRCGTWNWKAVANLGFRPTVEGTETRLEVHILDDNPDLYGKELEVELRHFLRSEAKFASRSELQAAIADDVAKANAWHTEQAGGG